MKASTYDYKIIRGKWLIYCKYGQGVIFTTNQSTCPCATRRISIYKGLATFHIRCSRNCQ